MDIVYGILLSCVLLGSLSGFSSYLSDRMLLPGIVEAIVNDKNHRDYWCCKNLIMSSIYLFIGLLLVYLFQTSIKESIIKVAQILFSVFFIITLFGFLVAIIQIIFFAVRNPQDDSYTFLRARTAVLQGIFIGIVMIILYLCGHPLSVENGFSYIIKYLTVGSAD